MTRALRLALLLVCFVLPASPAAAATFTVATTGDGQDTDPGNGLCATGGGACTLRAALQEAAGLAGADTVTVPSGTYALDAALGELVADSTVTVDGAGARTTILQAGANRRVLQATGNLTLRGVTVTGGTPTGTSVLRGGGILVSAGDVTLERVTVRNNTAASETHANGGGVASSGGSLTILDSTISDNLAIGRVGGSSGGSGTGGGVYAGAPTTIRRSTISGNVAQNVGAGQFASGGGVAVGTNVTLDHVSVVGNSATTFGGSSGFRQGGNVYASNGTTLTIGGSILANGQASQGPNCYAPGTVTESARNLADNTDCLGAGSLRNTNPKLGALVDNGGGTDTRRPAADSPALNAATTCGARSADQRGNALKAGGSCDLGAVELGADRAVTVQASKTAAAAGEDVTVIATLTNAGADEAAETLTLELPAGAVATAATTTAGTCVTGATVTCTPGTLGRNAGATIIATVRATGDAMTITARRGGALPDQVAANDAASVAIAGLGTSAGPTPGGGNGGGGPDTGTGGGSTTAKDVAAPALTGLKLVGRASVRRGAKLRFTLSEAATVRITAERKVRVRGKTRYVKLATTTAKGRRGTNTVTIPKQVLKTGSVRFTAVATDAAGNRSTPRPLGAKIRRR